MKKLFVLFASLFLIVPLLFFGCGSGDDGATGPQGIQGPIGPSGPTGPGVTTALNLESCAICHDDQNVRNGDAHQADYDQRFQDNVVVVVPGSMAYFFNQADNTHNVTFTMMKKNVLGVLENFDCSQITTGAPADSLSLGFAEYNAATRSFDPPAPLPVSTRMSLGSQSTLTYLGAGVCRSTVKDNTVASGVVTPVGDLSGRNGIIEINGRDDRQGTLASPSRVQLALFPFAGLLKTGTVNYVSAATVDGCQKCHTVPYLKHGFIYGRVAGDPGTDFYTCKGCHMDNGPGGHLIWQLLVDDPQLSVRYDEGVTTATENAAIGAKYAYRTRLMNDVHMSHAMEFAYPQSMANCVTCHAGKLANVLTDNNFVIETCKSCHPVTGGTDLQNGVDSQGRPIFEVDTRAGSAINKQAPALVGTLPFASSITQHNPPFSTACNTCHNANTGIAVFSLIHTGYDKVIYGAPGTKYSSVISVTIDNASFNQATNVLTWGFHATGSLGGLSSANIVPTVLVGLYGYDTKDYIFGPHETHPSGGRNLEAAAGTTHPRITITSPAAGSWNVSADLTTWAGWIDNNTVKRVEVAVMPNLRNADNVAVALNAPSRTFNLGTNAFQANYFQGTQAIARVDGGTVGGNVSGCNNCHEALATTFHTADRGGNIVVCRLCHTTKTPSSHLELQSRSIDSYAHAIHRFQDFDIADIDFNDPVEALHYRHHVQSNFPTFGVEDCRACHNAAKFNVPDQSKSLPGILSSNDVSVISNINNIPQFITGPATRACGACHRAEAIIANAGQGDPVKLASLNSHMTTFGYMVEVTSTTTAGRDAEFFAVVIKVFSILGEGTVLPAP